MLKIIDHGRIREIRLDRPPANAINDKLADSLGVALAEAGETADAVVISGKSGMFSAGLDVPELIRLDHDQFSIYWGKFLGMLETIARMPVPTAFALTGHAPAGGIVMAIFGDYRIMPRGKFKTGLNEVQVGLVAPPEAHQALIRLIGAHAAERILVAGEMMDSQRALEIGLVDELADDPEAVISRAIEWCDQHLRLPRPSMLQTRSMTRAGLHRIFDESSEADIEQFVDMWFQESTQNTLKALVEKLTGKK
ncbi:MAG: enoyl-CoA hydratase/isomerase family protein [Gammaproteobacteria bacterium]|jgi:enoyl-CoA hydratase/carnithine racemase|nr:enoyl-CoA hydratase/isomerase family protein [Gammaproteobacteria bacterium]